MANGSCPEGMTWNEMAGACLPGGYTPPDLSIDYDWQDWMETGGEAEGVDDIESIQEWIEDEGYDWEDYSDYFDPYDPTNIDWLEEQMIGEGGTIEGLTDAWNIERTGLEEDWALKSDYWLGQWDPTKGTGSISDLWSLERLGLETQWAGAKEELGVGATSNLRRAMFAQESAGRRGFAIGGTAAFERMQEDVRGEYGRGIERGEDEFGQIIAKGEFDLLTAKEKAVFGYESAKGEYESDIEKGIFGLGEDIKGLYTSFEWERLQSEKDWRDKQGDQLQDLITGGSFVDGGSGDTGVDDEGNITTDCIEGVDENCVDGVIVNKDGDFVDEVIVRDPWSIKDMIIANDDHWNIGDFSCAGCMDADFLYWFYREETDGYGIDKDILRSSASEVEQARKIYTTMISDPSCQQVGGEWICEGEWGMTASRDYDGGKYSAAGTQWNPFVSGEGGTQKGPGEIFKGRGCVVTTTLNATGAWSDSQKNDAVRWCEETHHDGSDRGKTWIEGYHTWGKFLSKWVKKSNIVRYIVDITTDAFIDVTRRNKSNYLGYIIHYAWINPLSYVIGFSKKNKILGKIATFIMAGIYIGLFPLFAAVSIPYMIKRALKNSKGLGDIISLIIKTVSGGRIRECGGCKARKEWLNNQNPFAVHKVLYTLRKLKDKE